MPAEDISAGEVYRVVDKLERRLDQGFKDIRIDLTNLSRLYVSTDKYEALQQRVADLEDQNKWMSRTIVALVAGAIITTIVGVLAVRAGIS